MHTVSRTHSNPRYDWLSQEVEIISPLVPLARSQEETLCLLLNLTSSHASSGKAFSDTWSGAQASIWSATASSLVRGSRPYYRWEDWLRQKAVELKSLKMVSPSSCKKLMLKYGLF